MKHLFCLILRVADPVLAARTAGAGRAGWLGLATGLIAAAPAWAAPTGGQVSAGAANIEHGATTTTVLQSSVKLAIDWRGFNVGAGETVRFVQPNSQAVALNRVLGGDPSVILGRIEANGQVFLINPNGVLFGRGAQVDVGGLVASTLNLNDADFLAGRLRFEGGGAGRGGAVRNLGALRAADGGYIALLGGQVDNGGTLVAKLGSVAMAAGNLITLDFHGDGMLKVAVDQGALASMVNNGGLIQADGGRVLLTAKAAGDLAGGAVNNTGLIQARTLYSRDGVIELLGDMRVGSVAVAGTLDASAAAGDGGHVDTSAARVDVAPGARVDTGAAAGRAGSWLIDPADFTIAASGGNISGTTLGANLGAGNVTIQSSAGSAGGAGDVNVNDAVAWSANRLTLTAARDVRVNATMSATGGASLTMNTANANGADAAVAGGTVRAGLDASGFTGRIDFSAAGALTINSHAYTVLSNVTQLQAVSANLAGYYALGSNIDASATSGWNAGAGFLPLGPNNATQFSGNFDGLGHSISGLTINTSNAQAGLFGYAASAAAVRNVDLTGGAISGVGQLGALIGFNSGRVDNVSSSASVTGSGDSVGGLIGAAHGPVTYARHNGAVSGARAVGGIVGESAVSVSYAVNAGGVNGANAVGGVVGNNPGGAVLHSSNAATLTGSADDIGGIVGDNNGSVTDNHNTGAVHGVNRVGGVTGMNYYGGVISDSDNGGTVGGNQYVGGVNGYNFGAITRSFNTGAVSGAQTLGGVAGAEPSGSISISYNTGSVTGTGNKVGGLVGDSNSSIVDSYSSGAISGNDQVGGVVGLLYNGGSLATSYSTGTVGGGSAGSNVGGLIGQGLGSVTNAVWDRNTSGRPTSSGGGTGVTSAAMRLSATFSGWNLSTQGGSSAVWRQYEGNTLPLLRAFLTPLAVNANPLSAVYDGNGHSGPTGVQYTGFTGGDTATQGSLSWGTAVNAGSYGLTGLWSTKYDIAYTGGVLTVAPRVVDLSGTRVYDASTAVAAGALTLGPLVGSEQLGLSGAGTLAGKNIGSGLALGIGSLALVNGANGGLANNYTLTGGARSVNITAATLTVAGLLARDKTYDGNASASLDGAAAVLSGVAGADSVTLGAGTASFANANAGVAKAVTIGALPLAGADAGNYMLTTPTGLSATIAPRVVNLSGSRLYNGGAGAAAGALALGPLVGAETLNLSGAGTLASKHIGNNLAVGLGTLALADGASGGLAANYTLSGGARTLSVTAAPLTVSGVTARNKVYDGGGGASLDTAGAALSGVLGADVVSLQAGASVASFADRNVGNAKAVTIGALPLTGADAGDYVLTTPTGLSANITPYLVNLSGSRVYDGGAGAAAGALAFGPLVGAETLNLSGAGTLASKHIGNNLAVGLGTLALADGGNGGLAANYTLAGATRTLSVTPATLTVSGITAHDKVYDGNTVANLDTSGAALGGVIGADAVQTGAGTASFADRHAGGGKSVTIGALALSGADAGDYVLAAPGALSADISPYVVGLSGSRAYDGGNVAAAGALNFGPLVGAEQLLLSGAGTLAGKHIGSGLAVGLGTLALADGANGGSAADYTLAGGARTLTVTPAALSVSGVAVHDKVYDGGAGAALNLAGAVLNGVIGADAVNLQTGAATASFADRHAGVGKTVTVNALPLGGADAGDYALTTPGGLSATISPYLVHLSGSRAYNGSSGAAAGALNMGALVGAESLILSGAGTLANKHIGNNLAVGIGTLALADGSNGGTAADYTLAGASRSLSVTPASLTVSGVTARNKVYDGGGGASLDTAGAALSGVIGADVVSLQAGASVASFADRNVGNAKAVTIGALPLTGAGAADYVLSTPTGLSANITPYLVNLSGSRVYDGGAGAAASALAFGPLVGAETLDLSGSGTLANKHIGNNLAVGIGSLALADGSNGGLAGNYTLVGGARTLSVTPAPLTVSGVTARDKVYDGSAAAGLDTAGAVLNGVIGADAVALQAGAGTASFADRHAGTGKAVTIGALPIGGADAGDYLLATPAGLSADISPYVVGLSGSRTYDGGSVAAAGALNFGALVGTEQLILSGAGTLAGKHIGNNLAVGLGTLALADGANGGSAADYTLAGGARTLTVTPAALSVSGVAVHDKVYDGGAGAALNLAGAVLNGVIGADAVTLQTGAASASFADRHAGVGKTVTVNALPLGGADAGDYALTAPSGLSATISTYLVNLSGSRVYDGGAGAAAGALNMGALVGAESLILSGAGTLAGKHIGNNLAVGLGTLALADGANGGTAADYTLAGASRSLSVTPATLTVSGVTARNKVYDGGSGAALDTAGAALAGVIGADVVAIQSGAGTASFANRNAGNAKAVTIGALPLTGADAGDYLLSTPTGLSANITPFLVNLSGGRVYDGGAAAAAGALNMGALVGAESLILSGTGTLASKHIGNNLAVGIGSLALANGGNGGLAGNYTLVGGARTLSVTPAPLTVSGVTARDKVYDGGLGATLDTAGAVLSGVIGADAVALPAGGARAVFADRNVGAAKAVTIVALPLGGTDGGDYALATPSGLSASITPYVVGLSGSRVYNGGNGAAAGALHFGPLVGAEELLLNGAGTLANKHVGANLAVGLGTLALANGANGGLAGNYTLVGGARTLSVTAAPLTLGGLTARDRVYDGGVGASVDRGGATLNGVLGGDAVTLPTGALTATFADRHAGGAKTVTLDAIALHGADAGDYLLSAPSTLLASITPYTITLSGSRVYDGGSDAAAGILQFGPLVGAERLNLSGSAALAGKNVGANLALATGGLVLADGANGGTAGDYTLAGGDHRLTVTPATLTVGGLAARDKVYDGGTAAGVDRGGAVLGGVLGADDVALQAGALAAGFADRHAGAAKTVALAPIALSGADAGNYVLRAPGLLSAAITPFVVDLDGARVYDGGNGAAAGILHMGALVGAEQLTLSGAAALADRNVGAHSGPANGTLRLGDGANGGTAADYTLAGGAVRVDITPALLTVTGLTARDKIYDGNATARLDGTTATLSGVLGTDAVTVHADTSVASFADARAGNGKTVSIGSVGLSGADAGNYRLAGAPSVSASIEPYLVRLIGARRYDAGVTAGAELFGFGPLVGDERLSLSGVGSVADKHVGVARPVALGSLALGDGANGGVAANYLLAGAAATLTITPAPLTLGGLSAVDKVYDGGIGASVDARHAALSGVLGADSVIAQMGAASASFGDRRVGAGKQVVVDGVALGGTDAGNYSLTPPPALSASITPATLTLNGLKANNKVYDGGGGATLDLTRLTLQGVIAGDQVGVDGDWRASFADRNAGRGKVVTVFGYATTGTDAGNYVLRAPALSADIAPAVLTVNALDQTKRAGAADPAPLYRNTALIGADQVQNVLIGMPQRAPGEDVGRYRIDQGSLDSADANYSVHFIPGSLLILPPVLPDGGLIENTLRDGRVAVTDAKAQMGERGRPAAGYASPANVASSIFGNMNLRVLNGGLHLPDNWQAPR